MATLTVNVFDKITSFGRWFTTYMNRNNKKKLINLLYELQKYSENFLNKTDITNENRDTLSYEIYLAAVNARQYIDSYHEMTYAQQDEWTRKYNSGNETDGIDLCGNKWVTESEIREFV
jgi:hypothetical protein